MPYPGESWAEEGHPVRQPHEYQRTGTAKLLTLFHPSDGHVRVKGVRSSANAILHPWLKAELSAILAALPDIPDDDVSATNRAEWLVWQEGLTQPMALPAELTRLRLLLIWDNLAGHFTPEMVLWLFSHGIMPLYTPVGGSWLNMTESVQRILKRRALEGQYPQSADEIIIWPENGSAASAIDSRFWCGRRWHSRLHGYRQCVSCLKGPFVQHAVQPSQTPGYSDRLGSVWSRLV
jgi:hypothetical protein